MSHKDINWTFNPPNASHRGGVWERMIRTTRKILRALANEQLLTDEQLLTFMAEAERIVNDRPITLVSNDSRDLPVLTPNMLLLMKNNTSIPQGVFDEKDVYAKRWWKQIQYLANVFWRRWLREYLPTLQQRNKWQREQRDVRIDDIVIIADDHTPRGQWPLGRGIEVIRNRDSLIGSCVIKTKESKFLRPIFGVFTLLAFLTGILADSEPQREQILFEKVDKNLDGYLTRAELDSVFLLFDTNGDTNITKQEFDTDWISLYKLGTQKEANVLFDKADANDDLIIDAADLPFIFKFFDANSDNRVSIDEFLTQWGQLTLMAFGTAPTVTVDSTTTS
ncbi:Hypothetical predicted protein [Mytilus galloprovincialis]|uniref:EF-hand domain-containing protein n=1 Tax=Mytilus galloprovincialis TaxID=29158 RepID=A0A8B6HHD9_MYTGA|nr:Hypothetical predicted protein [Mytilus galloprovincialis]